MHKKSASKRRFDCGQTPRGDSHMRGVEMLIRNFDLNPWRRPIWEWSKLPLTPDRDHVRKQTNIYFYISLCTALNIRKFCPERPKWDQNQKFAPRSETTSIPAPSICKILNRHLNQHLIIISTDTQSTQDWHSTSKLALDWMSDNSWQCGLNNMHQSTLNGVSEK